MTNQQAGGWDAEHFVYQCSDGAHNSFWATVTASPEWAAWEREVARRLRRLSTDAQRKIGPVFDIDECRECGWISPEHFKAFISFCKSRRARQG